jgi:hypothetical protein
LKGGEDDGGIVMHPEPARPTQELRLEERIQEFKKNLHALTAQVAYIEKIIRIALEEVNKVDLSMP